MSRSSSAVAQHLVFRVVISILRQDQCSRDTLLSLSRREDYVLARCVCLSVCQQV